MYRNSDVSGKMELIPSRRPNATLARSDNGYSASISIGGIGGNGLGSP